MAHHDLANMLAKARRYVTQGCEQILDKQWKAPEQYLVSPCPVSTALSIMALATQPVDYSYQLRAGVKYLESSRNPDGGWGRTPTAPSDSKSTIICTEALSSVKIGINPEAIIKVSSLIGSTWMQDVPDLMLNSSAPSPLLQLLKFFLTSDSGSFLLAELSYQHLPIVLAFLPPAGRPLLLALSGINGYTQFHHQRSYQTEIEKIPTYQSPNGGWCEDNLITALCILCLSLTGHHHQRSRDQGLRWLASTQYKSGAWPSFNQLINWSVGLTAHLLAYGNIYPTALIKRCGEFLATAVYVDGSFGTISPYAFPDTDDTAIALAGLVAAAKLESRYQPLISKIADRLLTIQNADGSWGTFPEFQGFPPDCTCQMPNHITSVDVTVHTLQALLLAQVNLSRTPIQQGLRWLAQQQRFDGSWKSTWYLGDSFATSQTLELFAQYGVYLNHQRRAKTWLKAQQRHSGAWPQGTAAETALAITALLKAREIPNSSTIQGGLQYLKSIQLPNGSFKPGYAGFYASGLYYEEPITETLAVIQALTQYGQTIHPQ